MFAPFFTPYKYFISQQLLSRWKAEFSGNMLAIFNLVLESLFLKTRFYFRSIILTDWAGFEGIVMK